MIPPHTNRYPKPPSGAATGWGRFFCVSDGGGERAAAGGAAKPPRPLARPAPFDKGAFFARAKPAREASPHRGGGRAAAMAGGALEVCGGGKLRRGQDPSLRGKRYMGGNGKVAGRACPAPTDCCENLRTRGAREGGSPPSFPLTGGRGRLRAAYMPPLQSCRSPLRGFGGTPEF